MLIHGIVAVLLVTKKIISLFAISPVTRIKTYTIAMDLSPICCSQQLLPVNVTIILSQLKLSQYY